MEYYFATGQLEDLVRVCKRESHAEARPNPPLWAKVLTHLTLRCQLQQLVPGSKSGGVGAAAAGAAAAADRNNLGSTIGGGSSSSASLSYGSSRSGASTNNGGSGVGTNGQQEGDSEVALCVDEDALEEAFDLLQDFLQDIENDQILPPLAVLQVCDCVEVAHFAFFALFRRILVE